MLSSTSASSALGKVLQRRLSSVGTVTRKSSTWIASQLTSVAKSPNDSSWVSTSLPSLLLRLTPNRLINSCCYSTTSLASMPLDEFRDAIPREKRMIEEVGKAWSVAMLQRKSYEDLHKLWYVLYKEQNMLMTEKILCRRSNTTFPQPERIDKVKESMTNLKTVLNQRKKVALNAAKWKREKDNNRAIKLRKIAKADKEAAAAAAVAEQEQSAGEEKLSSSSTTTTPAMEIPPNSTSIESKEGSAQQKD